MIRYRYIALVFLFLSHAAKAQTGNIEFIENKGQWDNRVRYMAQVPGGAVFVQQVGFTIVQHHPEDFAALEEHVHGHNMREKQQDIRQRMVLRSHAYKVEFLNANASPRITADKPMEGYNNYFIGNEANTNVGSTISVDDLS